MSRSRSSTLYDCTLGQCCNSDSTLKHLFATPRSSTTMSPRNFQNSALQSRNNFSKGASSQTSLSQVIYTSKSSPHTHHNTPHLPHYSPLLRGNIPHSNTQQHSNSSDPQTSSFSTPSIPSHIPDPRLA